MPLFGNSRSDNASVDTHSNTSSRKGSMFSNRRSPPTSATTNGSRSNNQGGFFNRRRSSSTSSSSSQRRRSGSGNGSGFLGMGRDRHQDSTILAARQKVTDAEGAEKDADRALIQARSMVREAREHVDILEREAREDAKRAKAKQAEAKVVSKSARGLGRHG